MQISGAKKLIDDRGGYRSVAEKLGWPITTVHTFYRNNTAPQYRWDAIAALTIVKAATKGSSAPAQRKRAA